MKLSDPKLLIITKKFIKELEKIYLHDESSVANGRIVNYIVWNFAAKK